MAAVSDLEHVYRSIRGGPELLEWFGRVPHFHDAEIIGLWLNRRSLSLLHIHGWVVDGKVDADKKFISDKHAVVTFEMEGVVYVDLDGFSRQNVIHGLIIRHSPPDPAKSAYYDFNATGTDFEIELQPSYGLDGMIRCNSLSISFKPGKPDG